MLLFIGPIRTIQAKKKGLYTFNFNLFIIRGLWYCLIFEPNEMLIIDKRKKIPATIKSDI